IVTVETAALPTMIGLAGLGALVAATAPRWPPRAALGALAFAVLVGGIAVFDRASLVDDAFISLRYADNLLAGDGLVWNAGERVEGITNLGWTLLLAVLGAVLPLSLEQLALFGCIASWLAVIGLVTAISRELHDETASPWLPWAAGLSAVHGFLTSFATTGLETELTAVLLLGGLYAWLRDRPGWASLVWMLAVVVRLDQALFWAIGAVAVALDAWPRRDLRRMGRYLLPLGLLAVVLLAKLAYYGDIMPNTYYAKNAGETYVSYGAFYLAASYVAGHLWVHVPLAVSWVALSRGREQRFAALVGAMGVLWHAYVLKVGGDFMLGRFLVALVPLLLLAGERAWVHAGRRHVAAGIAVGALLLGTARGVTLIPPNTIAMGLADESTVYPVTSWSPVEVRHSNFHAGRAFGRFLHDRGIEFPLATSGIGMLGYYSRMPVIDVLGLTDATIAHRPSRERGRPGHEKRPGPGYLDEREVVLERVKGRDPWDALRVVRLPPPWRSSRQWKLRRYDTALMERWRTEAPEIGFTDFDTYLSEVFLPSLDDRSTEQLEKDLKFLDRFYWDVNGRDGRRLALVAYLARRVPIRRDRNLRRVP
ncbi:MAG: hypothetical protein AAF211_22850, partial [Myxococcota bacterium]